MNSIAKLIKAKTIDFTQVLIKNYKKIGLNETEAVLIIKLNYLKEENNNFLSTKLLAKEVTLSENDLSELIIKLVGKGYIELTVDNNGKETFSLDGTIEKLGNILDDDANEELVDERKELLSLIVTYVETTFNRPCTSSDYIIINSWIDFDYKYEDIKAAILKTVKLGKTHLKYTDAILASSKPRKVNDEIEVDEEIKALLDNAYVKR